MDAQSHLSDEDDTREKLLSAAHIQFAERGFHGASIALIAGEVGLTKQALLYHFKRKEDLYSEVLKRISQRVLETMRSSHNPADPAAKQFEDMILGIYTSTQKNPLDTKVLMRELLDNQRREAPEGEWFHKTWLDEIISRLEAVEGQGQLSHAEKLSRIYLLISAIEFFSVSGAVLERFYGDAEYAAIARAYPEELRQQVRRILGN